MPEPLVSDPYEDPESSAELSDSVSMAALLLEWLSPLERAVHVLREVFKFSFAEVATAVDRSEATCRQLALRARRHMEAGRPRFEADRRKRVEYAERSYDALREGDVEGLREFLAADVHMLADGGGQVGGLGGGVFSAEKTARLLAATMRPLLQIGAEMEEREIDGQPAVILRDRDGKVLSTCALDILDGRIQTIRAVNNPDRPTE